ncbi:hypothetical protein [Lysinibacillus pakistanensis]|uniref:hypothetical protein n=1 Tax=Lysinibacillus pakistanensis TaxID=759811 RepID=UPI0034E3D342
MERSAFFIKLLRARMGKRENELIMSVHNRSIQASDYLINVLMQDSMIMFLKLVSIGFIPDLMDVKSTFCASDVDIQ